MPTQKHAAEEAEIEPRKRLASSSESEAVRSRACSATMSDGSTRQSGMRTHSEVSSLSPSSCSDAGVESPERRENFGGLELERFSRELQVYNSPVIVFVDNGDGVQQMVWHEGCVRNGEIKFTGDADLVAKDAVVMSPAYLGFVVEPFCHRYLHYKGVGMVFARPHGGKFMQPSIDTILICKGLSRLTQATDLSISRLIDVGTGSGFIGKFAAMHFPGKGRISATLLDIDPMAERFCLSPGFGARKTSLVGRDIEWNFVTNDALVYFEGDRDFDFVVSNPPYIPDQDEVLENASITPANFWEGCGLLVRMMEIMFENKFRPGARLVIGLTSLSLKSQRVRNLLEEASSKGVKVTILVEREIAWKAWYAGSGRVPFFLLANGSQHSKREQIGNNKFFVGATCPGSSRIGGSRNQRFQYHWHVAYVLELCR